MPLNAGTSIGPYVVEEHLGDREFVSTYSVRHDENATLHVLDLLDPELLDSDDAIKRFQGDAKTIARLKHGNLHRITDVVADGEHHGLVRDVLDGETLEDRVNRESTLPFDEVANVLAPVLEALHYVHERGIVHRDLRPRNVFLATDPDAEGGVKPLLVDFGIARIIERVILAGRGRGSRTSLTLGTPRYMSPEQVRNEPDIDRRCDLWAAGVMVYELMIGRSAFDGDGEAGVMQEVVSGRWGDEAGRESLPDEVKLPLKRCLAVSRDKRYPTARALRAALELAAKRAARA